MLVLILNNITLREVSQTEKDKHHIIFLICGIKRMIQMNLFTKQTHRHRNLWLSKGRRGEG